MGAWEGLDRWVGKKFSWKELAKGVESTVKKSWGGSGVGVRVGGHASGRK